MPLVHTDDNYTLYYESHGTGDPMVFVHPFGGDYRCWQDQLKFFSANYRCIVFSARGFKPSSIPESLDAYGQVRSTADVLALVDALALESVHLVGCSMGSFTALDFALEYPQRINSLTLIGNSSGPRDATERETYRHDWLEPEIQSRMENPESGSVALLAKDPAYQRFQSTNAEGWQRYSDNLREQSVAGAINILRTVHWNRRSLWNDRERLAKLIKPVLLAYGNEDFYLVSETNRFLHETLPNSFLSEYKPCGHLVHIEQASKFNQIFRDFLDIVPPSRVGGVITE